MRLALLFAFVCALPIAAQPTLFSASFNQNPIAPGGTVAMQLTATGIVSLSNGCGLVSVRSGMPNGPVVFSPFICPAIFIQVGPGSTWTVQWNAVTGGSPAPAGLYYIEVGGRDSNGRTVTATFPFRIDDAAAPTPLPVLSATSGASPVGNPDVSTGDRIDLTISSPADPGALYLLAVSSTTNTGVALSPTTFLSLDNDFLFGLSFPTPTPGIFVNFIGALDATGQSSGAAINVPPAVLSLGFPLAVQGAVIGTAPALTNPVCLSGI